MVESIPEGKADDPHGSETHFSEVVHEGEDAAFGDTTHDSVNTESATVTNEVDSGSVNTDDSTINQSYTDPTGYTQDRKLVAAKPIPTPTAYFSGPAHGEGGRAFIGATLAPDGRVVFAPFDSSNVGIFDPSDGSYTSGPAHGEGGGAFQGATLAPDGRVVFAPSDSENVGIASQLLDFAVANGGNK